MRKGGVRDGKSFRTFTIIGKERLWAPSDVIVDHRKGHNMQPLHTRGRDLAIRQTRTDSHTADRRGLVSTRRTFAGFLAIAAGSSALRMFSES